MRIRVTEGNNKLYQQVVFKDIEVFRKDFFNEFVKPALLDIENIAEVVIYHAHFPEPIMTLRLKVEESTKSIQAKIHDMLAKLFEYQQTEYAKQKARSVEMEYA